MTTKTSNIAVMVVTTIFLNKNPLLQDYKGYNYHHHNRGHDAHHDFE